MSATPTLAAHVSNPMVGQVLRALYPPSLLVHVGWGNGLGEINQWTQWAVPYACVIESEDGKLAACQEQIKPQAGWQTIHATLSAQPRELSYHFASNPSESGLLPPAQLRSVWPHLHTLNAQPVLTTTLDLLWLQVILPSIESDQLGNTWLIIDCLPSSEILAGAMQVLEHSQVICVRNLAQDRELLTRQLNQAGWLEVAWVETNHPAIGYTWYTRNPALFMAERDALVQAQAQLKDQLSQGAGERTQLQQQLEAANKAHGEHKAHKAQQDQAQAELQSQLAKAGEAQKALMAERDALVQAQAQLKDQLSQGAGERTQLQQQLEAANKAHEELLAELVNSKAEHRVQFEKQVKERKDIQKQADQAIGKAAKLQLERQALQAQLASEASAVEQLVQSKSDVAQLQAQLAEMQERQQLMNEELIKSEGQIELIKDFCLREPGI